MASNGPLPPDYFSDENISSSLILCISITRALAIISLILRLVARRVGRSKLWWDDGLIIFATSIHIPGQVIEVLEIRSGGGSHLGWVLKNHPETLGLFQKCLYTDQLLYAAQICPVKLSILCLYIRIFGVKRSFRYFSCVMIVLVLIWAIITEFLFAFQCTPVWVAWDKTSGVGTCSDSAKLFTGTNTANVIMDFVIFAMPIHPIWKLQLPMRKRMIIIGVFIFGGGTIVLSTLRLAMIGRITFQDLTWDDGRAMIWSVTEASIGMVLANIPVYGPLLPKSWTRGSTTAAPGTMPRQNQSRHGRMRKQARKDDDIELITPQERFQIMKTTEISISRGGWTEPVGVNAF